MSSFNRTPGTAVTVAIPEPNLATIPEPPSQYGMSATQITSILLAYWKQILIITLVVAMLGAVAIKFLPKTYTAKATLLVNLEVKDPLAGRDFPVEMITSYVSTQIELMTSPIVLLPVVDKLKLTEDKEFTAGFSGNPEALREFVQRNLAASVQVERGTGGQLLYISASAKSAARAAELANAIADQYIEQDRRRVNDPAGERAQRYSEELAELRAKAIAAQDNVTAFRKENGIGDMNMINNGTEVQALDTLHQKLLETQNQRRALEAKRSQSDEAAPTSKALLDAELQLAQMSGTYGPQHPKVKELKAQIALAKESLAAENHSQSSNTDTELARTKELEQKYRQAVAEQEAKVLKLRQAQDEGSKLLLELESAKSVYKQALDGFDQIMFQAVANHTNVSVVNRAVPPLRASKPNKIKLMMMVLLAGFGIGVGLPFAYGLFVARRLRCRDDVERDFGIAVLAQLAVVPSLARAT